MKRSLSKRQHRGDHREALQAMMDSIIGNARVFRENVKSIVDSATSALGDAPDAEARAMIRAFLDALSHEVDPVRELLSSAKEKCDG